MAVKPLLLFPSRTRAAYEVRPGGGDSNLRRPLKEKQRERIGGMFSRLNDAFTKHKGKIQSTADGLKPEMVLVFEIRGTIDDFFKAVEKVPEFKWLGEYEDDFPASDDFSYESLGKVVPGKLFFLLADNAAFRELNSLWNTWKLKGRFGAGLMKWRDLFDLLVDIRPWGYKDRIEETGILLDMEERIKENLQVIPFEIELWFRKSDGQRRINTDRIEKLLKENGGQLLSESIIEEISYHAILAEAPIGIFGILSEDSSVSLLNSSDIMYIRPVGQSIFKNDDPLNPFAEEASINTSGLPNLQLPILALFDGMPVQNHLYLKDRIDVYDPDEMEENYTVAKRVHSTGMASLIIHGDLTDNNPPLSSKLLVRPVMKYNLLNDAECFPENILLVDLIHKAVRQLIDPDYPGGPAFPSIKIINLSLGDSFRVFEGKMSSWAKLLDWLSEKFNILFIVSAGNVNETINLHSNESPSADFVNDVEQLQNRSIKYLYNQNRFRKIIAPAESINALTVGAANCDSNATFNSNNNVNLYNNSNLPSPISRMGLGFRKSIKPDILANGGRLLFRNMGSGVFKPSSTTAIPPGIKVAAPGDGGNKLIYSKGTSNSAALVSYTVGKLYEKLLENDDLRQKLTGDNFAIVSKALLVHCASWDESAMRILIDSITDVPNKREFISRFVGYGKIDPSRIGECTDKRVTLVSCESLMPDSAFIYELPLPEILSGTIKWRKLSLTLAWFTPINSGNQLYRTHKLWFDFPEKDFDTKLKAKRIYYDDDAVRRGTIQHEVFYSDSAQAFADNSVVHIKVNCKADALNVDSSHRKTRNGRSVDYVLVVTLEVDPEIGVDVDIYTEINNRIKQVIRT